MLWSRQLGFDRSDIHGMELMNYFWKIENPNAPLFLPKSSQQCRTATHTSRHRPHQSHCFVVGSKTAVVGACGCRDSRRPDRRTPRESGARWAERAGRVLRVAAGEEVADSDVEGDAAGSSPVGFLRAINSLETGNGGQGFGDQCFVCCPSGRIGDRSQL